MNLKRLYDNPIYYSKQTWTNRLNLELHKEYNEKHGSKIAYPYLSRLGQTLNWWTRIEEHEKDKFFSIVDYLLNNGESWNSPYNKYPFDKILQSYFSYNPPKKMYKPIIQWAKTYKNDILKSPFCKPKKILSYMSIKATVNPLLDVLWSDLDIGSFKDVVFVGLDACMYLKHFITNVKKQPFDINQFNFSWNTQIHNFLKENGYNFSNTYNKVLENYSLNGVKLHGCDATAFFETFDNQVVEKMPNGKYLIDYVFENKSISEYRQKKLLEYFNKKFNLSNYFKNGNKKLVQVLTRDSRYGLLVKILKKYPDAKKLDTQNNSLWHFVRKWNMICRLIKFIPEQINQVNNSKETPLMCILKCAKGECWTKNTKYLTTKKMLEAGSEFNHANDKTSCVELYFDISQDL